MNAANYSRIVPSDVVGVERVRAASLGPAVFRNRALLHYERKASDCRSSHRSYYRTATQSPIV